MPTRFLTLLLVLLAGCGESQSLAVENPWIRAAPPGAKMLAGYFTLRNGSDQPYTLLEVSSPAFSRVEIHRTVLEDDVARMVAENELLIPASSTVTFEPGGRHLMLIGPQRHLERGDQVTLSLHFSDGASIDLIADVRSNGTSTHRR